VTVEVSRDGPPRGMLIAAIAVAAAAVIAVLTIAVVRQSPPQQQPVAIAALPAPRAESPPCRALLAALPDQLGDYRRVPTAAPTPPGARAWQARPGDESVILRCGLDRPAEFVVGAPIQLVDGVQWFTISDPGIQSAGNTTWFTVDRPVYIALTLPPGSGPTPIQVVSDVVAATLPVTPIDPAQTR
jgi:hypothetical protein